MVVDWQNVADKVGCWLEDERRKGRQQWCAEAVLQYQVACALQALLPDLCIVTEQRMEYQVPSLAKVAGVGRRPAFDLAFEGPEESTASGIVELQYMTDIRSPETAGYLDSLQEDVAKLLVPGGRDLGRVAMIAGKHHDVAEYVISRSNGRYKGFLADVAGTQQVVQQTVPAQLDRTWGRAPRKLKRWLDVLPRPLCYHVACAGHYLPEPATDVSPEVLIWTLQRA